MNYEQHFKKSCELRDAFWKTIGTPFSDVIGNLINPTFMGGPKWPSLRQAHIGIKTDNHTIIATDGLSDPYDDYDSNDDVKHYNGIGLELYMICDIKFKDISEIIESWQFSVLRQLSSTAAANPNLADLLEQYQYMSISINANGLPTEYIDDNGSAGVLLGLENTIVSKNTQLSIENIRLVSAILLTPKELAYITENGAQARNEIAEKLTKKENAILVTEKRTSVV